MAKWLILLSLVGLGCGSHSSHAKPDRDAATDDDAGQKSGSAGKGGKGGAGGRTSGGAGGTGMDAAGSDGVATGTAGNGGAGGEGSSCSNVANACNEEGATCMGSTLVTCAKNQAGCLVTTRTNCARTMNGSCDGSASPPACKADPCFGVANSCNNEGTTCDDTTLVTCAKNADGCLVATRTSCTGTAGQNICSGTPAACGFDPCRDAQGKLKANVCASPDDSCAGDLWVHCVPDDNGCMIATRTDCTKQANKNKCDGSLHPPACAFDPCKGVTDCLNAGKTCDGVNLVECAANGDGCLVKSTTDCTQNHTLDHTCKDNAGTIACTTCSDAETCAGKSEGDASCDGNVFQRCTDNDGDTCLNAVREDCGENFTCDADPSKRCVYTGPSTCSSMIAGVLREPMSYGPFATTDAGNDYSMYTCPGIFFGLQAASPDLLFAVDVAPKSVVTLSLTSPSGFAMGSAPMLVQLSRCADETMDMMRTAESSCVTVSNTALTYTNETATDARIYVVVDANRANNADNVGMFGLTIDSRRFTCGDGKRDGSEACDDGNIASGDGCTPTCTREMGFACTSSSPSVCTQRPTNGVCANVTCPALPSDVPANTQVCCTADQRCGVAYTLVFGAGCIERDEPGKPDAACPDQNSIFSPLFPPLTGCCRPDNKCGLNAATGGGCTERSAAWAAMVDGFGDFFFTGPFASMSCTYTN